MNRMCDECKHTSRHYNSRVGEKRIHCFDRSLWCRYAVLINVVCPVADERTQTNTHTTRHTRTADRAETRAYYAHTGGMVGFQQITVLPGLPNLWAPPRAFGALTQLNRAEVASVRYNDDVCASTVNIRVRWRFCTQYTIPCAATVRRGTATYCAGHARIVCVLCAREQSRRHRRHKAPGPNVA